MLLEERSRLLDDVGLCEGELDGRVVRLGV